MGPPKGGGYQKVENLTPDQQSLLEMINNISGQNLQQGANLANNPLYQSSVEATKQFLPGGEGFKPIQAAAQQQFQQHTVPSIVNALGSNAKSSSALNQALASAGQNLNTNLASMLAQMQLQAGHQGAQLAGLPYQQGLQGANLGLGTPGFAVTPRAAPFWQQVLLSTIGAGADLGSAAIKAAGGAAAAGAVP